MEGYHHLTLEERVMAHKYVRVGKPIRWIARRLDRSPSTISREFRRNLLIGNKYVPEKAHKMARNRTRGMPARKIVPGTEE